MAAPSVVAVDARISEQTPRDRRGVALLARLALERLGAEPTVLRGRQGPFGTTPWRDDLEASRPLLATAGAAVACALEAGRPALTLAPDCALALGTLPALARVRPDARVLWLDAHSDYDTPATTSYSFLGAMSLAGAVGAWPAGLGPGWPAARVVLCGTRPAPGDFDEAAQRAVEASDVTLVPAAHAPEVLAALGDAPVYVHLDPDVLDPVDNPIPYGRPAGVRAGALRDLLAALAARGPVIGVEVTAFHSQDDLAERERVASLLLDAVAPLL